MRPAAERVLEAELDRDEDLRARAVGFVGTLVHAGRDLRRARTRLRRRTASGRPAASTAPVQRRRSSPRSSSRSARAVARRDHGDLPRGRHPQAAPRHAALAGHDSRRARRGEARLHRGAASGSLVLAGKRLFPGVMQVNMLSFTRRVLLGTLASCRSASCSPASSRPRASRSRSARPCSTRCWRCPACSFRSSVCRPRCGPSPSCSRRRTPSR